MRLFNTALLNKALLRTSCCVLALGIPGTILAQDAPTSDPASVGIQAARQATTPKDTSLSAPADTIASSELPDSPGAAWAKAQQDAPQQTSSPQSASTSTAQAPSSQTSAAPNQAAPNQTDPNQTDPNQTDQNPKPPRPVGTAAAEAPKVNGVTAAQPAGVAIAPAKQRRVRTIVLRVGALVGAGAALGTVIALTAATPSKPPGAH